MPCSLDTLRRDADYCSMISAGYADDDADSYAAAAIAAVKSADTAYSAHAAILLITPMLLFIFRHFR